MTGPNDCDGCESEFGLYTVSNRETGQTQFLGFMCLPAFAVAQLVAGDTEVADELLKAMGYQPTAAAKKARAGTPEPEVGPKAPVAPLGVAKGDAVLEERVDAGDAAPY